MHDSAEDVANLLKALYDGPYEKTHYPPSFFIKQCQRILFFFFFFFNSTFGDNSPDDFGVVSGVLRLANKYLIDHLREKALAHLSVAWPATLKDWDAREDLAGLYEQETGKNGSQRYPSPIVRLTSKHLLFFFLI
jgi:hypothetical protein